jgi:hypothetical protein
MVQFVVGSLQGRRVQLNFNWLLQPQLGDQLLITSTLLRMLVLHNLEPVLQPGKLRKLVVDGRSLELAS